MKRRQVIQATLLLFSASLAMADGTTNGGATKDDTYRPTSDAQKMATGAAVHATRYAVGQAIGGTVGAVIKGNPVTAAAGVLLTPSEIGCSPPLETCAKK